MVFIDDIGFFYNADGKQSRHEFSDLEEKYSRRIKEQTEADKIIIKGVGKDADIITNENGGKQSKAPMTMHLIDPKFLLEFAKNKAEGLVYCAENYSTCVDDEDKDKYGCYKAIQNIAEYMLTEVDFNLTLAMDNLECEELQQIIKIGKVLQYGADKYKPNNWRLIPEEEHINHALIHIIAHIVGDTQDEHIDHALCRLMMARATKKSKDFDYCNYVECQ